MDFFPRLMNQSAVFGERENNGVWHVLHQPTIDEMHEREAEREVFQIIKKVEKLRKSNVE